VHRGLARLLLDDAHRLEEDALCRRLLAVHHQAVDELAHRRRPVLRIGRYLSLNCALASAHGLLRPLCTVFGATLTTVIHTAGVERPANDVVTHTGQIFHTTAPNQYDRVLLQV